MWSKIVKFLALSFFYFYPLMFLSILIHPYYGPVVSFLFCLVVLVVLSKVTDLLLLSLLRAKEQKKSHFQRAHQLLAETAFYYRIPTPKLYFTYKGTKNIYAVFLSKKSKTLVMHEDMLTSMTEEELKAVFFWMLSPPLEKMFQTGTFLNSLVAIAVGPFLLMANLLEEIGFLKGKFTDGLKLSLELFSFTLIEMTHSIFFQTTLIEKADEWMRENTVLMSSLVSGLGKMEEQKFNFSWAEKILLTNRFSQSIQQTRVFSFFKIYSDPEIRIHYLSKH